TYLIKDSGKLRKETVYLRRGSSTAVAKPDEIAQMGVPYEAGPLGRPVLKAFWTSGPYAETRERSVRLELVQRAMPPPGELPPFGLRSAGGGWSIPDPMANEDVYR